MGDVAFEWTIPYLPGKKQKGFGLLLIGETAVFLFNGLFLVRVFLLVAVIMAVITFSCSGAGGSSMSLSMSMVTWLCPVSSARPTGGSCTM